MAVDFVLFSKIAGAVMAVVFCAVAGVVSYTVIVMRIQSLNRLEAAKVIIATPSDVISTTKRATGLFTSTTSATTSGRTTTTTADHQTTTVDQATSITNQLITTTTDQTTSATNQQTTTTTDKTTTGQPTEKTDMTTTTQQMTATEVDQTTTHETDTSTTTTTTTTTETTIPQQTNISETTVSTTTPKPPDDPIYFYFPKVSRENVIFDEAEAACKRLYGDGYTIAGRSVMNKAILQVVSDLLLANSVVDKVWLGAYVNYSLSPRTVLWPGGLISRPAGAPWCTEDTFAVKNPTKKIPLVITKASPSCLTLYVDDISTMKNPPLCMTKEASFFARNATSGELLIPSFFKVNQIFDESLEIFPDIEHKMNCLLDSSYCDTSKGESRKTFENVFAFRSYRPNNRRLVAGFPLLVDYSTAHEICSRMRAKSSKDSAPGRIIDHDLITSLNENNVTLNSVPRKEFWAIAFSSINKLVELANYASSGTLYRTKRDELHITTTGYIDVSSAYSANPPPIEDDIYQVSWQSPGGGLINYHVRDIENRTSIPVCKNAYINLFNSTSPFKNWRDNTVKEPYKSRIVSRLPIALSSEPGFETVPCWRFALSDLDWPGVRTWVPGCQLESAG